jgi:hypothetical protein
MHPHLPHMSLPTFVLSVVYAAAIAIAVAHPGRNTLAGLVVLAGLTIRWFLRFRRSAHPAAAQAPATAQLAGAAPS